MAILPPTELMFITRPLLRIRAGRSVWVTAMWPNIQSPDCVRVLVAPDAG
jgi:hypothetical protein